MDQDPIQQLQSFLVERGRMLEKITSLHSSLGSLRGDSPSSMALPPAPKFSLEVTGTGADAHIQRLVRALQEMQTQIEQRVRPAVQLLVQTQVEQLRGESDEKVAALRACLGQIDRCVSQCLAGLDEYQKRHADLDMLNRNLAGLGASPEPLPEKISIESLSESISARLANLSRG